MKLARMEQALRNIATKAPASMLEGLQLVWLYGLMSPLIEYGRLDEYIGDLYVHDIENGVLTEEEAVQLTMRFQIEGAGEVVRGDLGVPARSRATFKVNDLIGAAANGAKNHGAYVSAVTKLADGWKKAGLISGKDQGKITSCAARSDIP